jgi:hypothetical protein
MASTSTGRKTARRKPATVSVDLAARLCGLGRSSSYENVKNKGELIQGVPVISSGSRYRVLTAPLEEKLGIDLLDYVTDEELAADAPGRTTPPAA